MNNYNYVSRVKDKNSAYCENIFPSNLALGLGTVASLVMGVILRKNIFSNSFGLAALKMTGICTLFMGGAKYLFSASANKANEALRNDQHIAAASTLDSFFH